MKFYARVVGTIVMVPVVGALLLGCSKKIAKTDIAPQSKAVEQSGVLQATTPTSIATPGSGARQPTDRQSEEQIKNALLASRGEDIPIRDSPTSTFVDPSPKDRAVLRPIYFDYDKSSIKPEYQPVLENIAKWLDARAGQQLRVEGHCDERGTDEYNLALGERRALAIRRYLIALGISADRVHTISFGEEMPAVPGNTESSWSKNRRAEFKISAP